jgi:transposase
MDIEKGSRRYCAKRTSNFPVFLTCGWTPATVEKRRARTGCRRPWGGAWISSNAAEKACSQRCVLMAWAKEWAKEGIAVDWQKLLPPEGFQVLPRRWVVERTFSWIDQNRRMSKDYEKLSASSEAFV